MTRYLLLLAAATFAVPAAAEMTEDVRSVSVPVGTMRLDRPEAVAALRVRIGKAAREVCDPGLRSLDAQLRSQSCEASAIDRANDQLDRLIAGNRLAAAAIPPAQ